MLIAYLMILFWPALGLTGLIVAARLATRYVRAVEQRGKVGAGDTQLAQRVTDLETSLEDARSEIARLKEGQEFTTRLLAGRSHERV